jgi:hypothetical protein
MKDIIDTLKSKSSSTYVRAAAAAAVLVPLSAFLGGFSTSPGGTYRNHNETLVRDAA